MDMNQILEKLNSLEKNFNNRFEKIDERFNKVDERFEEQKEQNERFALEFQKHEDSSRELKIFIEEKHNEVLERSDEIKLKLDRLETERISANTNIERLDEEVRKLGGFG